MHTDNTIHIHRIDICVYKHIYCGFIHHKLKESNVPLEKITDVAIIIIAFDDILWDVRNVDTHCVL